MFAHLQAVLIDRLHMPLYLLRSCACLLSGSVRYPDYFISSTYIMSHL